MSQSPITDEERQKAEQIARDLIVPPRDDEPWDRIVPLTVREKTEIQSLIHRLVTPPNDVREDIRNVAALVDTAGATSGGMAMSLMTEFRELAQRHPQEFIEATDGDPARQVREMIAQKISGSEIVQKGIAVRLQALRNELAGPNPSPVEWQLADVAALAWLDFQRCVIERENLSSWDRNLQKQAHFDGRVDRAHSRYIRTIKALASVRKLDLTAVQINFTGPSDVLKPER
jgi:hypothetical protein